MAADFAPVFAALREVMLAASPGMKVARDRPAEVMLLAPWPHPRKPKEPMWFGSVKVGKAYVSYHLMPLYMNPPLQARVTPTLKRRMQGKTCFNFKAVDEQAFAELAALTLAGAEFYATPLKL